MACKPTLPNNNLRLAVTGCLTDPTRTKIGLCISPTHDNPFFCTIIQARHHSTMTDPGTDYEVCRGCTMLAEAWPKGFLEFAKDKSRSVTKEDLHMLEAKWMKMAEAMLIRKRPAKFQKTLFLCKKAIAGDQVEGDKFCGGDEMMLEIREREAQNEQHSVATKVDPKE